MRDGERTASVEVDVVEASFVVRDPVLNLAPFRTASEGETMRKKY